jgi:hypothetical protein
MQHLDQTIERKLSRGKAMKAVILKERENQLCSGLRKKFLQHSLALSRANQACLVSVTRHKASLDFRKKKH